MKQLKIVAITVDIDATRAFLDVIEQTDPYFSASYVLQINQTAKRFPGKDLTKEFPEGVEIARLFKQMYRQKTARGDQPSKAGFPGSKLQNEEAPSGSRSNQKCIDSTKGHPAKKCYILNKRLRPESWQVQRKYANGVFETLKADETFKKQYNTAYKELTAGNTEETEPVKRAAVSYRPALTPVTDLFVLTNPHTSFATATYPLRDNTIWDSGTTDHVTNNVNNLLSGTFRPYKPEPFFARDRILYIQGYGKRHLPINHRHDPKALFHLREVAYVPNFIINIVSHKHLKGTGYRLDDEQNVITRDNKDIFCMHKKFG